MTMFRKLILSLAAISVFYSSASFSAVSMSNYEEVTGVLEKGKTILLNFKPENCIFTPEIPKDEHKDRLVLKIRDLVENRNNFNGGKNMKLISSEESGLFGDKRFLLYRILTMVYEDGTVMVLNDNVNPTTYKLEDRQLMTCKLSADGSGGVVVTEVKD
jgi:hypothetical protein